MGVDAKGSGASRPDQKVGPVGGTFGQPLFRKPVSQNCPKNRLYFVKMNKWAKMGLIFILAAEIGEVGYSNKVYPLGQIAKIHLLFNNDSRTAVEINIRFCGTSVQKRTEVTHGLKCHK